MLEKYKHLLAEKQLLDNQIADCKREIVEAHQKQIDAKGFGTVSAGGFTFTVPKNVSWEQDELKELYKEAGSEYVDASFKVAESKFKAWPDVITKQFEHARSVKAGAIQVKIKDA